MAGYYCTVVQYFPVKPASKGFAGGRPFRLTRNSAPVKLKMYLDKTRWATYPLDGEVGGRCPEGRKEMS
jgi:hypothetical protein